MSNANLKLDLYPQTDRNGKVFHIAKLKGPFNINCKDGIVFLIFTAESGAEQMQIANMDKNDKNND